MKSEQSLLTEDQKSHWYINGWVHVNSAIDVKALESTRAEVDRLARTPAMENSLTHYFEETRLGRKLCRTERFIEHSEQLEQLITTGLIPDIASMLFSEKAVLFKEKINYKMPGGAGFSAHQDATAYDFVNHHITCLVALDDMTKENGCLAFSRRPGEKALLKTNGSGCIDQDTADALNWYAVEANAGDLVFFDSYTPHKSGSNETSAPRTALYLTYNAAQDADMRAKYYDNRDRIIASNSDSRISTIGHFEGHNISTSSS
ncbi:MAG: phytanoyl-CoA dioxygenase family protein [Acidiferrobacterales bacterium]|nr:phytanoyl-CoA dioxygenase family protein [Acidiferrobacterales bacterium]